MSSPPSGFSPTDEQKNILKKAKTGKHLIVEALAGTGKTSTMLYLLNDGNGIGREGIYFVYNKEMQRDAERKGFTIPCSTVHGFSYRRVVGDFRGALFKRTEIANAGIPGTMISGVLGIPAISVFERTISGPRLASFALSTVSKFCYSADESLSEDHVVLGDYPSLCRGLAEKEEMAIRESEAAGKASEVRLRKETVKSLWNSLGRLRSHVLDVSRDLWREFNGGHSRLPIPHDVYLKRFVDGVRDGTYDLPKVRYIILDEAQDSNGITYELAKCFMKKNTQIIVVGDEYQQLYEWRGASDIMRKIRKDVPDIQTATLSQSWRFGEKVADVVNGFMRAYMDPDFNIRGNPSVNSQIGFTPMPTGIVTRTNAGVMAALFEELQKGRIAYIPKGESFSRSIADIELLKCGRAPRTPEFQIFSNYDELIEFSELDEGRQIKMILKVIDEYGSETLMRSLQTAGSHKDDHDVLINTTHGWKGLESPSVVLRDDFPQGDKLKHSREEIRLAYVAMTRSKNRLDPGDHPDIVPFMNAESRSDIEFYGKKKETDHERDPARAKSKKSKASRHGCDP